MKRRPTALVVSVVLMASVVLASTAMPAEQFQRGAMAGGHAVVSPPVVPHGVFRHPNVPRPVFAPPFPRPFVPHHPFARRPFVRHRFVPFGVMGGPVVVYAAPIVLYSSPGYDGGGSGYYNSTTVYNLPAVYNSPAVYDPPVGAPASVAAAPAPTPNVIQYATGRYELRGDGLTVPYTWVWIPNPPPGPPPSAAPMGPISSGDSPAPSHGQVYRWTDTQGVLHMTDRWERVPPQYRAPAEQNQPS